MGYLIQFFAMASFGVSNCLWTYPLKSMPVFLVIALRAGITSVLFAILIAIQYQFDFETLRSFLLPLRQLQAPDIIKAIIFSGISYFGLFFFNKAVKHGAVSLSIPILCLGSIVGILSGVLLYSEQFSYLKLIITIFFVLGLWCVEKLNPGMWRLQFSKGALYSLLATLFWSTGIFFPIAIKSLSVLWFSLILELTVCTMSWIGFFITHKGVLIAFRQYSVKPGMSWIMALAICGFSGVLFSNLALYYLPLHILGMMGIIQPVVSLIIANLLLRERLLAVQYAGIFLILAGLWLSL